MSIVDKFKGNKLVKENTFVEKPTEYISTGSAVTNILFSGKIDGGIVKGKLMQIVAPSSLGKSMVGMKVIKSAQKDGMEVVVFDTEFAYSPQMARAIGVDESKLQVIQSNSIEDIQQMIMSVVSELTRAERENLLILIDSWGGLVTSKTTQDAIDGKDTTDMTISKKKNTLAKLLTGLRVTVFVVNQTYETMDQYNPLAVGGGKGLYYACSSIVMGTSKAKDKDSAGEVSGSIVTATTRKGRFCKEHSKLKYLIEYNGGIHPWYGILEDALLGGYVTKPTQGFYSRPCVPDDKKWRESQIWASGDEFWIPILQKTDFKKFISDAYTFTGEMNDADFEVPEDLDED